MKSIIKKLSILLIIGLMSSCYTQVKMTILNVDYKYLEVRNGERILYSGYTGGSNTTDQNAIVLVPINYNDSIFVEIYENGKASINQSYKLSRGKYLYIDNLTGDFSIYSQNKEKPLM
jgi:hypothetical protein